MNNIRIFFLAALLVLPGLLSAQEVTVNEARFSVGDNPAWSQPAFDDSAWPVLTLDKDWNEQGVSNPDGFGWYRIHVVIPSSLKKACPFPGMLMLNLGCIDDTDETWFNGVWAGKTGTNAEGTERYRTAYDRPRHYGVPWSRVKWDQENVIAVRVYNGGDPGGFYEGPVRIGSLALADVVTLTVSDAGGRCKVVFDSQVKTGGTLLIEGKDNYTEKADAPATRKIKLTPGKPAELLIPVTGIKRLALTYTDNNTGEKLTGNYSSRYILTPEAPATPRYNGPAVYGVTPGAPLVFRLAFSGEKPMNYAVEGLPEGVVLDADKGVLSGSCAQAGDYPLVFKATNAKGSALAQFTLKVGENIALTPPMGWNSWNCWGLSVSQEKVMDSAAALINRGLADYGYAYINLDDGWEAVERTPEGYLGANEKFPDMKGLGDWLHSNGLKFGIYSGPGPRTCGGYPASMGYERQDAETWASWGVDYLKYDWCSYEQVRAQENDYGFPSCVRPYLLMQKYVRKQPRDIFYSLGPLGGTQVYLWGLYCDGNSWRTAQDIDDTWESSLDVGFRQQADLYKYSSIGHWNDPDMLVVGKVGYGLGENTKGLRETRLTPDEQYTHITLWTIVSSNMLIGCDIAQMDDFTLNLLCNNEVNAINQDLLGKQADRVMKEGDIEVWSRPLADGAIAVGIFNVGDTDRQVDMKALIPAKEPAKTIRDLWRQKNLSEGELNCTIPLHGCRYLKVHF